MKLLFLIILLTLSSCATIINRERYNLSISSSRAGDKVKFENKVYTLPAKINVQRSKNDLLFTLQTDSAELDYVVKSSLNPEFLYGNLIWLQVSPFAYLIDTRTQKKYYYERAIYINRLNKSQVITPRIRTKLESLNVRKFDRNNGEIDFVVAIPYINNFNFKPIQQPTKSATGFFGISTGLNYYYTNEKYFNISLSAMVNMDELLPVATDYTGIHERYISTAIDFTNNHKLNRVHLGYGLSYMRNSWRVIDFSVKPIASVLESKRNFALGVTMNIHYQFTKEFYVGFIYRPSLFRLNSRPEFYYEHTFSLDLSFRVTVRK
jgi:hypothetical protein